MQFETLGIYCICKLSGSLVKYRVTFTGNEECAKISYYKRKIDEAKYCV